MKRLGIHKNIPVFDTQLTLDLLVGFISSHLTVDKLFPVNPKAISDPPKMSLLFEDKSMPALIIKPMLLLVAHTDDLGSTNASITGSKPQKDCQQTKYYARTDPVLHHKFYSN